MTIGVGNLGATGGKQVVSEAGEDMLTGIAIGMVMNTSHVVIVVPGGPLLFVYDFENETGDNELILHTITTIFDTIEDIGSEFQFKLMSNDENYVLKN